LFAIDTLPALTVTVPAFPVFPELAIEVMPVKEVGLAREPSIVSPPATLTETLPAAPGPEVLVEIAPLLTIETLGALTLMVPAFPVLPRLVIELIPCNIEGPAPTDMSIVTGPAMTETFPAFPVPLATVPRDAPVSMVRAPPTDTETVPPAPTGGRVPGGGVPQVGVRQDAASTFAPLCKSSSPATIEIVPPGPAFAAVEAARLDTVLASTTTMPDGAVEMDTAAPLPLPNVKACTMALLLSMT
jgi:hypothetical protein